MEPLRCDVAWHKGNRRVFKIQSFCIGGKWFEGCNQCLDGINPSVYSTEKKMRYNPGVGTYYSISPAHVRDIRLRKLAPDGRTVYMNRRGNVT